jgi:hypothetical protein
LSRDCPSQVGEEVFVSEANGLRRHHDHVAWS